MVLKFLSLNWGTILVGALVLAALGLIIAKLARDKRKGKHPGCGCGCAECPAGSACMPDEKKAN